MYTQVQDLEHILPCSYDEILPTGPAIFQDSRIFNLVRSKMKMEENKWQTVDGEYIF
jgi:hypothetical protein